MSFSSTPKLAVIELHYLPSIQFFTKLLVFEEICIEQHESYQKGSYRNRCHIVGANGFQIMSIPLKKGKHQKLPIQEVAISYNQPWHLQHWRSIKAAYANAPFFPYYSDPIKVLYEQAPSHLFAFNQQLFQLICQQIGISSNISYSREYLLHLDDNVQDLRDKVSPKNYHKTSDLHFQALPYPQVFQERHGFTPNLSILDLLFCTGPQALSILQNSLQLNTKADFPN